MQIVKGDGNSQLRKDEEIYLRKINSQRSTARKLKTILSPVVPFDGEELWGIPRPVDTMGVPAGSHATPSQKKRLGKMMRPRTRCQGSAESRTRMMMVMISGICLKIHPLIFLHFIIY